MWIGDHEERMQRACCFEAVLTCRQHCWMACFTALTISSMSSAAGSSESCRQPSSSSAATQAAETLKAPAPAARVVGSLPVCSFGSNSVFGLVQ